MASRYPSSSRSALSVPKVFFDVETPNARADRICSFSALLDSGKEIASLVDPETYFHPFNIAIHNITPEAVYTKPNFRYIWTSELREHFEGRTVVGYNVTFDLRVLTKTLQAYSLDAPIFNYVDVLSAARRYFDLPSYSLDDVAKELGFSYRRHNASEDVRATKIVFDEIAQNAPELLVERVYTFDCDAPKARW